MFLKLLLLLTMTANATDSAKFTVLEYKAPAPFAGVLFDEQALAKVLSGYDIALYSCEIKTEYELKVLKKTAPKYKWWWFVGGVAVGTASAYSAYKVFNE